jgi:hypothetical protein
MLKLICVLMLITLAFSQEEYGDRSSLNVLKQPSALNYQWMKANNIQNSNLDPNKLAEITSKLNANPGYVSQAAQFNNVDNLKRLVTLNKSYAVKDPTRLSPDQTSNDAVKAVRASINNSLRDPSVEVADSVQRVVEGVRPSVYYIRSPNADVAQILGYEEEDFEGDEEDDEE